jgi:hypothetical protein
MNTPRFTPCGRKTIKFYQNSIPSEYLVISSFVKICKKIEPSFTKTVLRSFAAPKLNCAIVSPEWGDDNNAERDNAAAGRTCDSDGSMVRSRQRRDAENADRRPDYTTYRPL